MSGAQHVSDMCRTTQSRAGVAAAFLGHRHHVANHSISPHAGPSCARIPSRVIPGIVPKGCPRSTVQWHTVTAADIHRATALSQALCLVLHGTLGSRLPHLTAEGAEARGARNWLITVPVNLRVLDSGA